MKEEVDFDPTKTETLSVYLNINDQKNSKGQREWAISGNTPWIINDVEEKIQTALGMDHLNCLLIFSLNCKSWVANEFLDVLTCYDLAEHGLDKLTFQDF